MRIALSALALALVALPLSYATGSDNPFVFLGAGLLMMALMVFFFIPTVIVLGAPLLIGAIIAYPALLCVLAIIVLMAALGATT